MSLETTTTTLTELVYGEYIAPLILDYAGNYGNPSQFFLRIDPLNGSTTVSVPRWVSDQGTANDDGVAVDTEFNATEATDLSNTELETLDATFSIAEYGLMRTVTDTVMETAQSAASLLSFIAADGAKILMAAGNDDACARFASFSNSSGTTNTDLSVATVDDAIYDLAERGVTGELVGILDHEAARNFQDALQAASSNTAIYAGAAERQMGVSPSVSGGRTVDGYVLTYKGVPFYRNGLCDTANTAADVVSAIFTRGDVESQRTQAALGQGSLRDFRIETQRDASLRGTEVVMTMRWGCGIIGDTYGQKIISDAP
jgi:hypothetical protein